MVGAESEGRAATMTEVDGMMYCVTHGGICVEGTDYTGEADSLGCEYAETESQMPCRLATMYFEEFL